MDTWRLLLTPAARGAWNMAVDEAILEHVGRGETAPTLRLYAWQPPCLSLGHAQAMAEVDFGRLRERGWEMVRRLTGGRAILHTDELTYSVIVPPDEPRLAGSLLQSYQRLGGALLAAVRSLGLSAEMKERALEAKKATPNPVCFEMPSSYEITVNGKKLIGSAQARRREGVLQHGSLPLTGDLTRITQVLAYTREAERQEAAQRLRARAATLEALLGHHVSWDAVAQAFVQAFEVELNLRFAPGALSESERQRADELVREKYAHPAWNERI